MRLRPIEAKGIHEYESTDDLDAVGLPELFDWTPFGHITDLTTLGNER